MRRYRSGDELDEQGRQEAEQQAMAALAERMGEEAFGEEQRLVDALIDLVARIRPEDDAKLSAVKVWLREFHAMQPGERVILFTEFVDTLTPDPPVTDDSAVWNGNRCPADLREWRC